MALLIEDIRLQRTNTLVSNIGSVQVPTAFKKSAQIKRLSTVIGSSGNVIEENYTTIVDSHNVCAWPLTPEQRYANEKIGVKVSHEVHPIAYVSGWQHGDFYYFDSKLYRIVAGEDFAGLAAHFKVWEGGFGMAAATITTAKRTYLIQNVTPGVHVFGAGFFSGVAPFDAAPAVIGQAMNDSEFYVTAVTKDGFTLVDRMEGSTPLVQIYIRET